MAGNCTGCIFSEGIDGTDRLGCQYDTQQHDMDDSCKAYISPEMAADVMKQILDSGEFY